MGRFLRKDDIKDLRRRIDIASDLGSSLLPQGSKVEGYVTDKGEVFAVNSRLAFFARNDGVIFPLLVYVLKSNISLPRIVVDMKAVPHICNGADIFRPGIRNIDPDVRSNQIIVVVDERNAKPICIGLSLMDAATMQQTTKGKVVKNLHYVGDSVWDFSKSLEKRPSEEVGQ